MKYLFFNIPKFYFYKMATLTDIKNNVQTIENISEEVFKYEMEISHLHENSEYYIIKYYKIYTSKGYNYILRNADGNFYWATPGTKKFIEEAHCPPEFEIKTYEYNKLINEYGYIYLDEHKKPILELEADFKIVDKTKIYKPNEKPVEKNKVVDDYYVSSYIYGLKYSLSISSNDNIDINEVINLHIDNLEKYFKQYHEQNNIKEELKNKFDNLEQNVKEKYIDDTRCFIKFWNNKDVKEKLKIHLDNIEKYVIDYYEAEAKRIITYY